MREGDETPKEAGPTTATKPGLSEQDVCTPPPGVKHFHSGPGQHLEPYVWELGPFYDPVTGREWPLEHVRGYSDAK